jgi:hypothetical protein
MKRAVLSGLALLASGILFQSCGTSIGLDSVYVNARPGWVYVRVPGLIVNVSESSVWVRTDNVNVRFRN